MEEHSKTTDRTAAGYLPAARFDPIEIGIRERVCGFIQELLEQELTAALGRTNAWWVSPKGYRDGT